MRPVRSFHARMASFTFAILLPLGGCTGSVVHGRVGGDKLPPLTAGFWTSDDQTPDRFYVGLTAMDVPDACTSTVGYTQAYLDADAEYTTDHDGADRARCS